MKVTSPATGRTYTFSGKHLGSGAFGSVYECVDDWENTLAAKIFAAGPRAQKEALALVRLRHPNTTYIHDLFDIEQVTYIVMEKCEFSLETLLTHEPGGTALENEKSWLVPVSRQILQAIHYIHQEGFTHADIHCGNIMGFCHDDEMTGGHAWTFKLGDFGISRPTPQMAESNTFHPSFTPPETLNKTFGPTDRRVDLYHFGLVLLRISYGHLPAFSADDIVNGAPRELAEGLPSRFRDAIARCLRRRVDQRTQTALSLWEELQRLRVPPASAP